MLGWVSPPLLPLLPLPPSAGAQEGSLSQGRLSNFPRKSQPKVPENHSFHFWIGPPKKGQIGKARKASEKDRRSEGKNRIGEIEEIDFMGGARII